MRVYMGVALRDDCLMGVCLLVLLVLLVLRDVVSSCVFFECAVACAVVCAVVFLCNRHWQKRCLGFLPSS